MRPQRRRKKAKPRRIRAQGGYGIKLKRTKRRQYMIKRPKYISKKRKKHLNKERVQI